VKPYALSASKGKDSTFSNDLLLTSNLALKIELLRKQ